MILGACTQKQTAEAPPPTETTTSSVAPAIHRWRPRLDVLTGTGLHDDDERTLATHLAKGRPTLFAFWATYCPPCIDELPMFEELFDEGHAIVGVSLDSPDEKADVARILEKHGATYPQVVLDSKSMKIAGRTLEQGLPFTLVLDARGRVHSAHHGKLSEAEARAALDAAQ